MTIITPTPQKINPPSHTALMDDHKRDFMLSINCARVGKIVDYDAGVANVRPPTATVQIAQQQVTSIALDGTKTYADYPPLPLVPVVFWGGGGISMTWPVAAGDECLLVFHDRDIDNWFLNGAGQPPLSARVHDFADAFAIVGLRSGPRALGGVSTTAAQIRTDDGSTFVEVNPTGVKVHAGTVYEWDVNGLGEKWTWTGGTSWTHDTYFTGATITTNAHNIAPPGPP